jgi:hypothetical protein
MLSEEGPTLKGINLITDIIFSFYIKGNSVPEFYDTPLYAAVVYDNFHLFA